MTCYRSAVADKQIARVSAYIIGVDPAIRAGADGRADAGGMTGDQA